MCKTLSGNTLTKIKTKKNNDDETGKGWLFVCMRIRVKLPREREIFASVNAFI